MTLPEFLRDRCDDLLLRGTDCGDEAEEHRLARTGAALRDAAQHLEANERDAERVRRMWERVAAGPQDELVEEAHREDQAMLRVREVVACIGWHLANIFSDHPDFDPEWEPM